MASMKKLLQSSHGSFRQDSRVQTDDSDVVQYVMPEIKRLGYLGTVVLKIVGAASRTSTVPALTFFDAF